MFEKIKSIFAKIFKKQKLLEENNSKTEVNKNNFREELSKQTQMYNLQKLYEEGKITEDDMQINQIKKLISLYKEQISMLDRENI